MKTFSTRDQLDEIKKILTNYIRLPFSDKTIPGAIMEAVLAHVRGGEVLRTYDFADVVRRDNRIGWQVKSTKESTPVTWKRAKIPNSVELIKRSQSSKEGLADLGLAIISFCNAHALESLHIYDLDEIGYCRLIIHEEGAVTYFEKILCTKESPMVFDPSSFDWHWSTPKVTKKKEQLPALHGIHRTTGKKWWAWHGLGENQLHFSGEKEWWPSQSDSNWFSFKMPNEEERIDLDHLMDFLSHI